MTKPQVFHLNLGPASETYTKDFFDAVRAKVDLKRIGTLNDATALFTGTARPPVFTDDEILSFPANQQFQAQAIEYVRSGGTFITMASYGSSNTSQVNAFFEELGLTWKKASYYREEFSLNSAFNYFQINKLPFQYSMKGVHLIDVKWNDCLYAPTPESEYEALGLRKRTKGEPVDEEIVAVANAKVGEGKFGYVCDVSCEVETVKVLLTMLGVQE